LIHSSSKLTTITAVALPLDIPINSNVIGAQPVTQTKNYARDVPFAVAFREICQVMGLDPTTASIGFKWDNERANVAAHMLATAADWDNCLETGIGMMQRARVRKVACKIRNLVRLQSFFHFESSLTMTRTSQRKRPRLHAWRHHLSCPTPAISASLAADQGILQANGRHSISRPSTARSDPDSRALCTTAIFVTSLPLTATTIVSITNMRHFGPKKS
jgi:hypothetical protein